MKSLDEYLKDAERAHSHLCAGQVLGVRMAMLGLAGQGQRIERTAELLVALSQLSDNEVEAMLTRETAAPVGAP